MDINENIFIAGHTGMVGSAIQSKLESENYNNLLLPTHSDLDLLNQKNVESFFQDNKPSYVFLAAAKVGGIKANNDFRADFIYENLMIQNNVIHAAHKFSVKKLLFLGSACIYPRNSSQPIKEEYLLSDYLELTNEPYAIAKIAGIKLCESYYYQYKNNFISIMPNNLYGPNDNFNLETSHVLPALVRKFHEAKLEQNPYVEVWGSGNPLIEFLYVDDIADACIFLMKNIDADRLYNLNISHFNCGSGDEITIKDLSFLVKQIVGYQGNIKFNHNYPDGTPRKLLEISRIKELGWKNKINLEDGIKSLYKWYINNSPKD